MSKSIIKRAYRRLGEEYYEARKYKSGVSYFYNELLEFPTTFKLLGNIKGKRILDLGCGPGIHAKKLFDMGAKIKGIDISKELIELARKEAPEIEFKLGDAEKLPYKNSEFDIVVSSLVLCHLKNWGKVLREVKRVLKRNGIFIFSGYNPVTEKFVKIKWFFRKFRELIGYFEEGEKRGIWTKDKSISSEIMHYHKTYGTIIRLLVANGFEILDYEDCKPLESAKKDYPKEYQRSLNYPHFCAWKVRKK
jgi:ubiquinone/menaquinone biosynthesis C-methylase UbiE